MTWGSGTLNIHFESRDFSVYDFISFPLTELKVGGHHCLICCPLDGLLYCHPQTELCLTNKKIHYLLHLL